MAMFHFSSLARASLTLRNRSLSLRRYSDGKSIPCHKGGGWLQGPRIRVGVHGSDPGPKIYVFFGVPNLDAAMENVRRAGGHADTLITDEPNFGRFANCRDPLGIPFGLHQPLAS
jgi:hypothetical protein